MKGRKDTHNAMNIERLYRMHQRIESETTGTPEEFAEVFNIRRRQLYNLLEELRLFGAVIKFSRIRKTFFYAEPFVFSEALNYDLFTRQKNKKFLLDFLKEYLAKKTC